MTDDESEKVKLLMIELFLRFQKIEELDSDGDGKDLLKTFKRIKSTVDKIVKYIEECVNDTEI